MSSQLDLHFGPDSSPTGFTPAGIAAFDDLRPGAIVRELIQNSLDAAKDCGREVAIVRFRVTECNVDDIPGIDSYARALDRAIDFHSNRSSDNSLPRNAQRVVEVIQDVLEEEATTHVLSVIDNGVGLDQRRMDALLSDGISFKGGNATGTYGNGHCVAIPASDLRYVLYGGVDQDGQKICGGHAVLASFSDEEQKDYPRRTGNGLYVKGFSGGNNGLFQYATDDDIPTFIDSYLDDIAASSDYGSAVILPGFNFFREDEQKLADTIAKAAACNFFAAIDAGKLEVVIESAKSKEVVNKDKLHSTLARIQDDTSRGGFLNGKRAWAAYKALREGESSVVPTKYGQLEIRILQGVDETRIDLCRNRMWITDDRGISAFRYKFGDRMPFHAVLLLDADQEDGGILHQLVRDAEGPLHDTIREKNLSPEDRNRLRKVLKDIRQWLLNNTETVSVDSFALDDLLALNFGDDANGDAERVQGFWGIPTAVQRRISWYRGSRLGQGQNSGSGIGQGLGPNSGKKVRVLSDAFQVVSVPLGDNRRKVEITCLKDCDNAWMRWRVDENVDATCDSLPHETVPVVLEDVVVGGSAANGKSLLRDDSNKIIGLALEAVEKGQRFEIEAGYCLPSEFGRRHWRGPPLSLKVEVLEGKP